MDSVSIFTFHTDWNFETSFLHFECNTKVKTNYCLICSFLPEKIYHRVAAFYEHNNASVCTYPMMKRVIKSLFIACYNTAW